MRLIALILAVVVAACAFMLSRPRPKPVDVAAVIASTTHASDAMPAHAVAAFDPDEEPDEASLRRLLDEEYAAINRQGGMKVTLTANGKSTVLHPTAFSAHKDGCKKVPHEPGHWECGLAVMSTLHDGDQPLPSGERVFVKRGPKGDWVAG